MKSSSEIAELVTRRTMPTVLDVLEGRGVQVTTDLDSTIRRALKGAAYQGAEEARLAALTEKENA